MLTVGRDRLADEGKLLPVALADAEAALPQQLF